MTHPQPAAGLHAASADHFHELIASTSPGLIARTFLPGEQEWDVARRVFQAAVEQRPAAIVEVETVDEVRDVIRAASSAGLRVAPQSTGHNAAPLGDLSSTVLLRTQRMQALTIDPDRRSARVGAGVTWGAVVEAAAPLGLSVLAGTSPTVGVVGYLLGGGLAWLGRAHGMAANHVSAIEVVTADGEHRLVDQDNEPDLFWALRGGGGTFAVVTAVEFDLLPTRPVFGGSLMWPVERAAEVLHSWRDALATMPNEIGTLAQIVRVPDVPDVPEPLRGRAFASVQIASLLSPDRTIGCLDPLLRLDPEIENLTALSPLDLMALHMDPPGPIACAADGVGIRELTTEVIDVIVAAAGADADTHLSVVEIRDLRGGIAPGQNEGGATAAIAGDAILFVLGVTPTRDLFDATKAQIEQLQRSLAAWSTPTTFLSFVESSRGPESLHPAETLDRLIAIKHAYDPSDLVQANHPVRRSPSP